MKTIKRQRYDSELLGSTFAHNAETAVVSLEAQAPKSLNIVTPCHGVPLDVSYDGITIYCSQAYCSNEWGRDGILDT